MKAQNGGQATVSPDEPHTPKKPRRFAVEPVETSSRSSQQAHATPKEHSTPSTGAPNVRNRSDLSSDGASSRPPRMQFAPQPIETSTWSHRKQDHNSADSASTLSPTRTNATGSVSDTSKKPARRKFAPQLIETAQRSRNSTDEGPTVTLRDRTNASPGDLTEPQTPKRPSSVPTPPVNTPTQSVSDQSHLKTPPNRQGSTYPHYNTRQHSFKVPDLPAIDSSESSRSSADGGSKIPSLSRSSSHSSPERKERNGYKDATRRRESADDRFSGYLLSLAARAAEKQLHDQAAAAFPNSDFRDISQQVNHFVDHEDSDEEMTSVRTSKYRSKRSMSDEEGVAALKEMQRHGASKQIPKETDSKLKASRETGKGGAASTRTRQDAWTSKAPPKKQIGGRQNDPDLRQMRKAASPPMLGGDIDFPRCPSPENARFDVTQGIAQARRSLGYSSNVGDENGLWGGPGQQRPSSPQPPTLFKADSNDSQMSDSRRDLNRCGGGLWGGLCTPSDHRQSMPSGIMTPRRTPQAEKEDPLTTLSSVSSALSSMSTGSSVAGPRSPPQTRQMLYLPTPPSSQPDTSVPIKSGKSDEDSKLEEEFPDEFVTQVYNYLSLGFPALARKFDEELSRISGVAIEELRTDDKLAESRGYLRLGEDEVTQDEAGVREDSCVRWCALRIYCREWGRQMEVCEGGDGRSGKSLDPHRAWGLPGRKGSWGN